MLILIYIAIYCYIGDKQAAQAAAAVSAASPQGRCREGAPREDRGQHVHPYVQDAEAPLWPDSEEGCGCHQRQGILLYMCTYMCPRTSVYVSSYSQKDVDAINGKV